MRWRQPVLICVKEGGTVRKWWLTVFQWLMYVLASMEFIRIYVHNAFAYIKVRPYIAGVERLPFQERILPVFLFRAMYATPWIARHLKHDGVFSREDAPYTVLVAVSLPVCFYFLRKLYLLFSADGRLEPVVYPVFLFTLLLTYTGHMEQGYRYPYDLPGVAFFTAGLCFIAARKFWPLLAIVLVGTLNRETTLFLIGIYALDAMTVEADGVTSKSPLRERLSLHQLPWLRTAALLCLWVVIKASLAHHYRFNDRSEDFLRFRYNLKLMQPRVVPALLNICGYLLPVTLLLRSRIRPIRLSNYALIIPVWFAVMFATGVLTEVRIYGELCGFCVVASLLILEEWMDRHRRSVPVPLQTDAPAPAN